MRCKDTLLLLACVLPVQGGLAQTSDAAATKPETVVVARCQYISDTETCSATDRQPRDRNAGEKVAMAQFPRRIPGSTVPPQSIGYPSTRFSRRWMAREAGRHALIGGLIGFGLGAAICPKANGGAPRI